MDKIDSSKLMTNRINAEISAYRHYKSKIVECINECIDRGWEHTNIWLHYIDDREICMLALNILQDDLYEVGWTIYFYRQYSGVYCHIYYGKHNFLQKIYMSVKRWL